MAKKKATKKKPIGVVQDFAKIVGHWATQPASPDEQKARLALLRALLSRCESRVRLEGGGREILRTDIVVDETNIVQAVEDAFAGLDSHPAGSYKGVWTRAGSWWPRGVPDWPRLG